MARYRNLEPQAVNEVEIFEEVPVYRSEVTWVSKLESTVVEEN